MQNNQKEIILLKDLGMEFATTKSKKKVRYGLYKCFCGNEFKGQTANINNGSTKSCGCLRGINHSLSSHRLYKTWHQIIHRCTNPKCKDYKDYGLRGITICDRWLDINNFIEDMFPSYQEGVSIDRINNDLGYSLDNCRWTTKEIQHRNTRKLYSHNTSGFRGVHFHKRDKKWVASIKVNSKKIHIGYFDTPLEAAYSYDNYVIANNLEHTRNFDS